jgi:spore germination cell wall hydrolase CwlJ-like protein
MGTMIFANPIKTTASMMDCYNEAEEDVIFDIPQAYYDKYDELAEEYYYDELELLACLVWAEAESQDQLGKELVVDVVLNRVIDPAFPSTIKEVIFQKNAFSPVANGRLNKAYENVTQECFDAVAHELEQRHDVHIVYFTSNGYSQYGRNAYKHMGHFFSYKRKRG